LECKQQTILLCGHQRKKVFEYNPANRQDNLREFTTPQHVGAVVPTKSGELLVALQEELGVIDLKTGEYTARLQYKINPDFRANDGKCAPDGSFWFGTMGYKPFDHTNKATLNRVDPDFSITQLPLQTYYLQWNRMG
jgi:sugar lactone lactonase YvrE